MSISQLLPYKYGRRRIEIPQAGGFHCANTTGINIHSSLFQSSSSIENGDHD